MYFRLKNILLILTLVIMVSCAPPRVKLTSQEKKCLENISQKYACSKIQLMHSSHFLESGSHNKNDSTLTLTLSWDKTQKNYRVGVDMCNGDSSILADISRKLLAPELLASLNHRDYYRYLKIYFETQYYEYIGPGGDTLRDSRNNPLMGINCIKSILLQIHNTTFVPTGFSNESQHYSSGQ